MSTPVVIIMVLMAISTPLIILSWKKKVSKKYPLEHMDITDLEEEFWFKLFYYHKPSRIYKIDRFATELARDHCAYLLELDKVTHENGHVNFPKRSKALIDLGAKDVGEIVGVNVSIEGLFDYFLNSPSHKRAIDNPNFNACGIGIFKDHRGALYCTVLFFKV